MDTETITALSGFLKYGPIGLAALMLVLVVIALWMKDLDERKSHILERFMYVGLACFTLSIAANFFARGGEYPIHFSVIPHDAGSSSTLPRPIIKINNTKLNDPTYVVSSEITAVVDVTDSVAIAAKIETENRKQAAALSKQAAALNKISKESEAHITKLQSIPNIIARNCSGGPHGIPASNNPQVLAITTSAATALAKIRADAELGIK